MRFFQCILFTIVFLCFDNCKRSNSHKNKKPTDEVIIENSIPKVSKIILSLGGCEGNCPVENVQIDSNLNIILFVEHNYNRDSTGFYIGKIDAEKWDSIINLIRTIDFNQYINSNYATGQDDELLSIRIEMPKLNIIIGGNQSELPKPILNLMSTIIIVYNSANLKHTKFDSAYIKSNAFLN